MSGSYKVFSQRRHFKWREYWSSPNVCRNYSETNGGGCFMEDGFLRNDIAQQIRRGPVDVSSPRQFRTLSHNEIFYNSKLSGVTWSEGGYRLILANKWRTTWNVSAFEARYRMEDGEKRNFFHHYARRNKHDYEVCSVRLEANLSSFPRCSAEIGKRFFAG